MLEVEMKFRVAEFSSLAARLAQWGARQTASRQDIDHYFNAPDRDFARTDEALRLRRIDNANFVTYKGPKIDAQTKTRTEIEVPLADGDDVAQAFIRLLTSLGYRPTAVVSKRRQIWGLHRQGLSLEVCLDEVDSLGRFLELEIMAPLEQLEDARRLVLELAAELGLTGSERRSYLELLLEKREKG